MSNPRRQRVGTESCESAAVFRQQVEDSARWLAGQLPWSPDIVILLGSGLGEVFDTLVDARAIPYAEIPHFPVASAPGHEGKLIAGLLSGRRVVVLYGRSHYYEGYSCRRLTLPVRILSLLGAGCLIVTNAAGGLNPLFTSGDLMIIRDHLNFIPDNPLRGPNVDEWGPRFVDLSAPYDHELIRLAGNEAARNGIDQVTSGVYVAIPGPSLETPAETRYLRSCGADAVGMSTVPEVIVARHAGMRVLGISVIANVNDPDNFVPIVIDDVLGAVGRASQRLALLLAGVVAAL